MSLLNSLHKLLELSISRLTKTPRPENSLQLLRLVEHHTGYKLLHKDEFSTQAISQIPVHISTKEKEKTLGMDGGDQSNSNGGGTQTLSKRAQKRLARCQRHKEQAKQRKAEQKKTQKDEAGYCLEDFHQSTYYFENGLRKVYPYTFTFATYAKGRWVGRTIKSVLEKEFGFDQPEDLLKAFNTGRIHVNDEQVGPDYIVRDCDHISHKLHRHENPVTWAPIEVIKDTEDLIVINKPSSIPCHPCGRYRFNSIVFILGKEMGYTNLRNIYRLDRLTSGVLILAKTTETTKTLEDQVVNRQVQKEYVCRVAGKFPQGPVTVDQPLRALSNKLRLQIVCPTGKASQTEFELVSYNGKSSVVKCRPFTGRTHQIRVHLQYLGHPIINDAFYNNTAWGPGNGRGGNYEIPFEDVCAKILKEHHANLWDGGENPLYYEKIREMEDIKAAGETTEAMTQSESTTSISLLDKLIVSGPPEVALDNCESNGQNKSNLSAVHGSDPGDLEIEPPIKKLKEEKDDISNCPLSGSRLKYDENLQKKDNVESISDSNKNSTAKKECQLADVPNFNKDSLASKTRREGHMVDGQRLLHHCLDGRPGFEMSRWSVDTSCDLCKKLPIEPRKREMVMFLHALKYKGPGWEYETDLPEWAAADWSIEEDYIDLESANFR